MSSQEDINTWAHRRIVSAAIQHSTLFLTPDEIRKEVDEALAYAEANPEKVRTNFIRHGGTV